MMAHRAEPVCHVQELGCYLQGHGHNKGLYNHNMTVSTISMLRYFLNFLKNIFYFFIFITELILLVDDHKPEQTLKICFCCLKGQGHSNG